MQNLQFFRSERELYDYISKLLGLMDHPIEEVVQNVQFQELWDRLSDQIFLPILYSDFEVSTPLELIGFLLLLLDIDYQMDENENIEENDGIPVHEKTGAHDSEMLQAEQLVKNTIAKLGRKDFIILWNTFKTLSELTFVVEDHYVDRIYRDSYYTYYSNKHFEYSRYCKRVFIFKGCLISDVKGASVFDVPTETLQECLIGSIVIRPLEDRKIGRSLLNPFYIIGEKKANDVYLRTANYDVTMFGIRLRVNAFPYSMQDRETTSCAEITILNMMDYFSRRYNDYRFLLPSDIISIAVQNDFQRRLPTKGLDYHMISRVFMEDGFFPVLYSAKIVETPEKFKRILHAYIESGIPTAVSLSITDTEKHSIVCIGHAKGDYNSIGRRRYSVASKGSRLWLIDTADFVDEYILMDDNQRPYSVGKWEASDDDKMMTFSGMKPEFLMVPLYKRMFLEASDAYDICTSILADNKIGFMAAIRELESRQVFSDLKEYLDVGKKSNPIIIRMFMTSARGFKKQRVGDTRNTSREIMEVYVNTPLPRFVWVCELYLQKGYPDKCCGEVVIDATSSSVDGDKSVLIIHYPHLIARQLVNRKSGIEFDVIKDWEGLQGYRQNLCVPVSSGKTD